MLKRKYQALKQELGAVTLIAVTKYAPPETINALYKLGHRDFGENKVQDALQKAAQLPKDIHWHMIGHLQTNKVAKAVSLFKTIQSIDSQKILSKINTEAKKINKIQTGFIEINLAEDPKKHGLYPSEIPDLLSSLKNHPNVTITGIMIMAPHTKNPAKLKTFFKDAKILYTNLKTDLPTLATLSMGMSNDYKLAIESGSNMVRIGSYLTD